MYKDGTAGDPWHAGNLGDAKDEAEKAGVWDNKNEVTMVSWHGSPSGHNPAGIAWMGTLCTHLGVHTCEAYVWKGITAWVSSQLNMIILFNISSTFMFLIFRYYDF